MPDFDTIPFQYNPAVTNINIDNQLAGILSQFNDDYIMDIIDDSLEHRFRLYDLPMPNIVNSYEMIFKQLTNGFSSNVNDIAETRTRVYRNIITKICEYYNLQFNDNSETDYFSAAYWLYDFLISRFTQNLINFYSLYLVNERESLDLNMGLSQMRRENDTVYSYSKRIFKDPKLAAVHANLEYVIDQMSAFDIDLWTILTYDYMSNPNLAQYIYGLVTDTGNFYKNQYVEAINNQDNDPADILMHIKMEIQQLGSHMEPVNQ